MNTHGSYTRVETACSDVLALVCDNIDSHGEFDMVSGAPRKHTITGLVHHNNVMTRIRSMPVRRQYCFYNRAFVRVSQALAILAREICITKAKSVLGLSQACGNQSTAC